MKKLAKLVGLGKLYDDAELAEELSEFISKLPSRPETRLRIAEMRHWSGKEFTEEDLGDDLLEGASPEMIRRIKGDNV